VTESKIWIFKGFFLILKNLKFALLKFVRFFCKKIKKTQTDGSSRSLKIKGDQNSRFYSKLCFCVHQSRKTDIGAVVVFLNLSF